MKKQLLVLLSITVISVSCGKKEYPTITLNELDPILKEKGELITTDFFNLAKTFDGLQEFRQKEYITPLAHGSLAHPKSPYFSSPLIFGDLGKIYSHNLYKVVNQGVVTSLRYKINCEHRPKESVEFRIDVNLQHKLSKMYLFLYDSIAQRKINVFAGAYIKL